MINKRLYHYKMKGNANRNGKRFEDLAFFIKSTRQKSLFSFGKTKSDVYINFIKKNRCLKLFHHSSLMRYMKYINVYKNQHLKIHPDDAILDESRKALVLIEKKFQRSRGSADEKLQTGGFKKQFFSELYPGYTIKYCYVVNLWFKHKKYIPIINYLKSNEIPVFFFEDKNFHKLLFDWVLK